MRPDDHDLCRLADDGCPHHDEDPAAEPVDEAIARLINDTRRHEADLALARRNAERYGNDLDEQAGGEGWGDDSGRYDDDPNPYEGTYSEE